MAEMDLDATFGQRLRRARLIAGLSQSELEGRSGIPKARLSRYENGHVLPSLGTLQKLASALGVSEATLLGDRRAILEGFFDALGRRGVRIESPEAAERLANAVADVALSIGGGRPDAAGSNGSGLAVGASPS
jgi:transcriptional regulator with XRE-family HTH domain